jgi:hypothetical protein
MSYPPGENSGYQGYYYFNGCHVYFFLHLLKTLIAIDYRTETAAHGYAGGFTAPQQQPHPNVQTIYGQTQNPGSWHHQSFDEATEYASRETGHDKSMFSSLLSSVMSGQQQHEQAQPHEIEQARAAHQKLYGGGAGNANVHQDDIASAAAMQAVERSESSSGGLQSAIGMAMSEVTKLMGKQGGGSGTAGYGNTQQGGGSSGQSDMVKKAVSMAIKLYASKQAGSAVAGQSGGGSSGNPLGSVGGMMNMFLGGGGGSKPSSSQGHDQPSPPTQQSHYSQSPSSGYAPPQSHQGGGGGQHYSSPPPSDQGYGGYSQPPSYNGQQQQLYGEQQGYGQQQHHQQQLSYGEQQGYGQQQHHQQQQSYGEQQGYGQQQQSYHGDQQGYGHQQQQQPYEGQQQQQQKPSGGGIEAVAANLLSKFLK